MMRFLIIRLYNRMSVNNDVESYLKFLLFLIKLSFSDTTVIEGGRERKHS